MRRMVERVRMGRRGWSGVGVAVGRARVWTAAALVSKAINLRATFRYCEFAGSVRFEGLGFIRLEGLGLTFARGHARRRVGAIVPCAARVERC